MRKITCILALFAAYVLTSSPALAAAHVPGRVSFSQSSYWAHENQGFVNITIRRTNPRVDEWIRYGVRQASALNGKDFDAIPNSLAHFAPGQSTYTFKVHIYDRGIVGPKLRAVAYMYGSYPQRMVAPHQDNIYILRDDRLEARDPTNPLETDPAPTDGDPLQYAKFYIAGSHSPAGHAANRLRVSKPDWSKALWVIGNAPGARRFWFWNEPNPTKLVSSYLEWTQVVQPGTVVQLSTYSLVHGGCGRTETPGFAQRYLRWIDRLAKGIGNFHVVMFFEIDSLITTGCLTPRQRYIRLQEELRPAIDRLEQDPHLVLYLDGGPADAAPWRAEARMLNKAGVHDAQGFFLNATHFDWTTKELYYGQRIARALGGVHFVINTGENGRGPLIPPSPSQQGNEVLCNPPGRGLGPLTVDTGYKWADGFLWFSNPGGSGGPCRPGAPATAHYWPAYAVMLVRNAVYRVTGPSYPLVHDPGSSDTAPTLPGNGASPVQPLHLSMQ